MSEENLNKTIVRYPPSPTGNLHIGNVRTMLFNFIFAEQKKGDKVLRFEDTDTERSKKEYEQIAIETLDELGIKYDRGPFRQTDRLEFYQDAIETLIRNDKAFEAEESKDGGGKVIRFRNPNKKVVFEDKIRGKIEIDTTDFGDFVIARNINSPLYHLTVVVDDIDMGVTDIIRGEDHITSTPRQILLIEALGGNVPTYAHLPLIVGEDKKKLSKRHGAVTWKGFKELGYVKEGVVNYLALLGWHPQNGSEKEKFSIDELIEEFRIEDVSKSPAMFSYQKLDDINKKWLVEMDNEEYKKNVLEFCSENLKEKFQNDAEKFDKIVNYVIKERISKFSEIRDLEKEKEFDYFFENPDFEKEMLIFKDGTLESSQEKLKLLLKKLEDVSEENWNKEYLKEFLWDWTAEVGRGEVLHPFRTLLSGLQRSPDPFTISEILGRDETLKRIKNNI